MNDSFAVNNFAIALKNKDATNVASRVPPTINIFTILLFIGNNEATTVTPKETRTGNQLILACCNHATNPEVFEVPCESPFKYFGEVFIITFPIDNITA